MDLMTEIRQLDDNITVEEYLRQCCDKEISMLMEYAKLKIEYFKKGAEQIKQDLVLSVNDVHVN